MDGTTLNGDGVHPTGLNYLKRLGVTHVQLQPIFDFATVDEVSGEDYNWGYDPLNYNLPEGSYATDAFHGEVRVRECRAMVQALLLFQQLAGTHGARLLEPPVGKRKPDQRLWLRM